MNHPAIAMDAILKLLPDPFADMAHQAEVRKKADAEAERLYRETCASALIDLAGTIGYPTNARSAMERVRKYLDAMQAQIEILDPFFELDEDPDYREEDRELAERAAAHGRRDEP